MSNILITTFNYQLGDDGGVSSAYDQEILLPIGASFLHEYGLYMVMLYRDHNGDITTELSEVVDVWCERLKTNSELKLNNKIMSLLNFKKTDVATTVGATAAQPDLKPIQKKETPESSQVKSIEYDPNKSKLTVHFRNGSYEYTPVPQEVATEAWAALSIGKFINTIKNKYLCKKV